MQVSLEYNELNPHLKIGKFMRSYYMSQCFVMSLGVADPHCTAGENMRKRVYPR